MNSNEWNNFLYNLHHINQQQEEKIKTLEEKIDQLERKVQEKSNNTVEKVEYHFDQLKIENLNGTLHIGLSPNDLNNIEEFDVAQTNKNQPTPPPLKQTLMSELNGYVQETCPSLIQQLSDQYNRPIDEEYQTMMIQDIAKQLPQRIAYYEEEAKKTIRTESDEQLKEYITNHIKKEINHSLTNYMQAKDSKGDEQ
ncbi:spore germination protein GerPC [Virgibacillus byunsanensis]|uniref:Spore germination protein GerPC n=1 Tax=Virgibacillus byunsanensis TaxID=570945 RepID=A0ABW3LKU5_9BACI